MKTPENTILFQGKELNVNNSMLLFLGSGEIDSQEYALWSLVVFNGDRINDSEQSDIYVDVEFATPLLYAESGNVKLLDVNSELFFSKVHHLRVDGVNLELNSQTKGSIYLNGFSNTADDIKFEVFVEVNDSLLEVYYNGKTKLIVMN